MWKPNDKIITSSPVFVITDRRTPFIVFFFRFSFVFCMEWNYNDKSMHTQFLICILYLHIFLLKICILVWNFESAPAIRTYNAYHIVALGHAFLLPDPMKYGYNFVNVSMYLSIHLSCCVSHNSDYTVFYNSDFSDTFKA